MSHNDMKDHVSSEFAFRPPSLPYSGSLLAHGSVDRGHVYSIQFKNLDILNLVFFFEILIICTQLSIGVEHTHGYP